MSTSKPKSKAKTSPGADDTAGSRLLLVGFVLFLVSWFTPAYAGQELFGSLPAWSERLGAQPNQGLRALSGPDWLPGWNACSFAWQLLTDDVPAVSESRDLKRILLGATCLTNLVMLLAMLRAVVRRAGPGRAGCGWGYGIALLACAALNAGWIYHNDRNPFDLYRAGYYLWLASFVITGVGALLRAGGNSR